MSARDLYRATVHEAAPPARPVVTHGLPQDIAGFTGRERELEHLLAAAAPGRVVNIHTIDGMPGAGKTALVIHAAHKLASRFPDGQFFHDLHAHSPGLPTAKPVDVLAVLLTNLGIDPRNLPATLEGRASLWRDWLAGKRVLLVLDDAAGHAQIQPLLPGSSPHCLTLVTSRDRLIALDGADPLSLDPLAPGDAADLFTHRCHRTPTSRESEAVAELVQLCGYLPLAIVLLASRLRHKNQWSIAEFAAEFTEAQDRLGELAGGDRAVRTAFTLSYQGLPDDQQRLFRRIGLHPGPDLDTYAAAALDDAALQATRHRLDALFTAHLLEEPEPGRYHPHDLLRTYAHVLTNEQDPAVERAQATERLLDHYEHTAQTADHWLNNLPRPATPLPTPRSSAPVLRNRASALAWMRTERANLLAWLDTLIKPDQAQRAIQLTAALAAFLRQEGPWPQAVTLHQRAVTATRHTNDALGKANALSDLGRVRYLTGGYEEAARLLEEALALYKDLGSRLGHANALWDLGRVRYLTGDHAEAARLLEQALPLYKDLGSRPGQANALWDLGRVRYLTGEYVQAAQLLEEALVLYKDLGDRQGQANALNDLGGVRYLTGEYAEAARLLEQALALYKDLGDRPGQAGTLKVLGNARCMTDDHAEAARILEEALALFQQVGDRDGQATAVHGLGNVRYLTGEYAEATRLLEQALALYQDLGDRPGQAQTVNSLGRLRYQTGDYAEATRLLKQALALYKDLGSQLGQANAVHELGRVRYLTGDYAEAARLQEEALARYEEADNRLGQAYALNGLGSVRCLTGDYAEAARLQEEALVLFREGGDRHGQAEVWNSMGLLLTESRGPRAALPCYQTALELARQIQSPIIEARALEGTARCLARTGDRKSAVAELREAVAIYRRVGAAEETAAAEVLASLEAEGTNGASGFENPTAS